MLLVVMSVHADETPNQRRERLAAAGMTDSQAPARVVTMHFHPLTLQNRVPRILSQKAGNTLPRPLPQSIDPISMTRINLNRAGNAFVPSPDGLTFVYVKQTSTNTAENRSELWLSDQEGKEEVRVSNELDQKVGALPVAWSDDGAYLLYSVRGSLCGEDNEPCYDRDNPPSTRGFYAVDIRMGVTYYLASFSKSVVEGWPEFDLYGGSVIIGFIRGTHSFVFREAQGRGSVVRYDLDKDIESDYIDQLSTVHPDASGRPQIVNRTAWGLEADSIIVTGEGFYEDYRTRQSSKWGTYIARLSLENGHKERMLAGPVQQKDEFRDVHVSPDGKRLAFLEKMTTVPPGIGEYNLKIKNMDGGFIKDMGSCGIIRGWFGNDHIIIVVFPKDINYGKMYVTGGKLESVDVENGSMQNLSKDEVLIRYQPPVIF
jgi:hypothetical protein